MDSGDVVDRRDFEDKESGSRTLVGTRERNVSLEVEEEGKRLREESTFEITN